MPSLRIQVADQTFLARLPDGTVRIGRDAECDLRIDDPSVGAVHASIEPLATGAHLLKDENTGRPTRVNGLTVKRVSLAPGDVIEIGPARLTYDADDAPPAPPRRATPIPVGAPALVVPAAVTSSAVGPVAVPSVARADASRHAEPLEAPDAIAAQPVAVAVAAPAVPAAVASSSRTAQAARRKLATALVVLAVFGGAALLLAHALGGGDGEGVSMVAQSRALDAAIAASAAGRVDEARTSLTKLSTSEIAGIATNAQRELDGLDRRIEMIDRDLEHLRRRATSLDDAGIHAEVESLRVKHGALFDARAANVESDLAASRRGVEERLLADARAKAATGLDLGRFSAALEAWEAFERETPPTSSARTAAEEGRREAERAAASALTALFAQAAAVAKAKGPSAAAELLHARDADFAGTAAVADLADRQRTYAVAAGAPAIALPPPTNGGGATTPTPHDPLPGGTPSSNGPALPTRGTREDHAAALAELAAATKARRFAVAATAAERAAASAPSRAEATRLGGLAKDLGLAAEGLARLSKEIVERSDRFTNVEVRDGFSIPLVDVEPDGPLANVRGTRTRVPWDAFDADHFAPLVERAKVPDAEGLPLAALLRAVGAADAAERRLARYTEAGGATAEAFAMLARWRGEAVPKGGYVAHAGRLVTIAERDAARRAARLDEAAAAIAGKDPVARRAAAESLLSQGEEGLAALGRAVTRRRAALLSEIRAMKVFTAGKTRQRLKQEVEARRVEALALIEDAGRYPYPSATHAGQDTVDHLVDRVREAWERGFDLVAGWDRGVADLLDQVRETDAWISKAGLPTPEDLDETRARVSKAIDVPSMFPDDYSRKVLAYNERITTTAVAEEKDNVRAVNEYRIMMGRQAVRIEERLVRAARSHSIEMRTLRYFAHESPTPGRRSPGDRVRLQGYGGGVGENIAMGVPTGRAAFDAWFHSSGHHRNMLAKGWTEMGTGMSRFRYWTQNFGASGGRSLTEPAALPPPAVDAAPDEGAGDGSDAGGEARVPDAPVPNDPGGTPPDDPPPPGGMGGD